MAPNAPIEDRWLEHYTPLISDFVGRLREVSFAGFEHLPQPFIPLFGTGYDRSALRMIIVGQDTKGWEDLSTFVNEDPAAALTRALQLFRTREFVQWGEHRHTFFGFVMMLMARLHGIKDWQVMKRGACREVLNSFAWGNANAIEFWTSSVRKQKVPRELWDKVRKAGACFNGVSHLITALAPRVILVLWKKMSPDSYFGGYRWTTLQEHEVVRHYRISSDDEKPPVDVLHAPHPNRMKFEGGADMFCQAFERILESNRLNVRFRNFVQKSQESLDVLDYLQHSAPSGKTKFQLVEWMAEELKKRDSYMSVPALCSILNKLDCRTNYGSEYSGRRGSYRLVRATYSRLHKNNPDQAALVAQAFRRPNFEYAYST